MRTLGAWTRARGLLLGGVGLLVVLWVLPLPPYVASRDTLQPPSLAHWLGTNDLGQDVALGLAHAAPTTLVLALSAAALALVVAVLSAYAAALYGGWVDQFVLRVVDGLQIVPSMLLALLVAAWVSPGFWGLVVLLGGLIAYDDVRVLRAVLLRELSRENVRTARILGGSSWYVLRRHVVPAIAPVLTVVYLQSTRQAVMKGAGLAFLGLTDPRTVTWGAMMEDAMGYLSEPAAMWLLLPPMLCLSLLMLVLLIVGSRVEDDALALEQRQRA